MKDPDQSVPSAAGGDDQSSGLWAYDGLVGEEEYPEVQPSAAFISLGFIAAALKRGAWLLCVLAVAGVAIGYAAYVKYPPAYKASATVLLTNNPAEDAAEAIATDAALVQSTGVAARTARELGLRESASSLIAATTATVVTDQILVITVSASSSYDAVRETSAFATNFLEYRAQYLRTQQQQTAAELSRQINQAQQNLSSVNKEISQLSALPPTSARHAKLVKLETQQTYATDLLTATEGNASGTLASSRATMTSMINGSEVLDSAAALPRSHLKGEAFYLAAGLVGGLALGIAIVVVMAITSTRPRRRQEIADVLGAPVRLSLGARHGYCLLPGLRTRAGMGKAGLRRTVAHLSGAVPAPGSGQKPASLAVVAVDNEAVAAQVTVSLARYSASKGKRIVVADLSAGARAARLLGSKKPGIHAVPADGGQLAVVVPPPADFAPMGPLCDAASATRRGRAGAETIRACADADLILTLASLDPALGGDHLATWASNAVAIVTAGRSSQTRIRAVGEMVRLAGIGLDFAVLVGADTGDESLGTVRMPLEPEPARHVDLRV